MVRLGFQYNIEIDAFEFWFWDGQGDRPTEPLFRVHGRAKEELTSLMDNLWNAGIRPTSSRYHSDQVSALQAHLSDLRDIARHALKMPTKE